MSNTKPPCLIDTALSNEAYHAHPAISNSLISKIVKSPAHAQAYLNQRDEPSTAMLFGTAFHTAVLEPERFNDDYSVFDGDKRTKEGKALYAELEASGQTIITASDYECIIQMVASIRLHPAASKIFAKGKAEVSCFWTDEATGLECKCRPDWWIEDALVDVKTTEDASPAGFAKSIAQYGYHRQAAHYLTGTGEKYFLFVAVEKKAPYAVGVYQLDVEAIMQGEYEIRKALDYWASCVSVGVYPAYQDEVMQIGLPRWAIKGEQE